jgi:hypothetical protein
LSAKVFGGDAGSRRGVSDTVVVVPTAAKVVGGGREHLEFGLRTSAAVPHFTPYESFHASSKLGVALPVIQNKY